MFVAGRSRASLLPGFRVALDAERAAEISRALDAVVDIAEDRHRRAARDATGKGEEAPGGDDRPAPTD